MIILNDNKFAENEGEFQNSLFSIKGTCSGYAKRLKRRIKLFNHRKELIGIINRYGVICHASVTPKGYWYTHATIQEVGEYESYAQKSRDIESLATSSCFVGSGIEKNYTYK